MKILGTAWKALLLLICLAVLVLAGFLAALHFHPSSLRPVVERGASHFLGRDIHLKELTRVSLGEDTVVELRGLEMANASWAGPDPMFSVSHIKLELNLPSLWSVGSIVVRQLEIDRLTLELLAPEGQVPNWELPLGKSGGELEQESDGILFPVIVEHVRLTDIRVGYSDVDQNVDIHVEQLKLDRNELTGLSRLSLAGVVNELPLSGEGVISPTEALQTGRNLELDLGLAWGEVEVKAAGSIADALALTGADLALDIRAPHSRAVLDLLGLQEVRDGPLVFEGRLADASPGLRVEAEGELADFGLGVHGVIEKPRAMDGLELAFYMDGPSMAEAGEILGVDGFKDVPFDISGEIDRRGSVLKLKNGQLRAAQGSVTLSGVLPAFPDIDDWQADIKGRQLDLSVLEAWVGVGGVPVSLFDIEGRLYSNGQGMELMGLKVTDGDLALAVDGVVGELPDFTDMNLQVQFSGNDLSGLQSLIGLETLPSAPFEVVGALSRDPSGWQLEKVHLLSQGFRVDAAARLDRLVNFQRLDGHISISSPDVPAALREYGVDIAGLAPLPLNVSAKARLEGDGFELSSVEGKIGATGFSGNAWLSAVDGFAGSRVTLEGQAENMGDALAAFADAGLPGQPFKFSLDATYHAPLVSIDRLQASTGSHTLAGNLTLEGSGEQQVARGQVLLQGKSAKNLMLLAGLDKDIADGSYRASTGLEMSSRHFALQGLQIDGVNSDLGGDVRFDFGETPNLDMDLHSRELHLPSLFPELDSMNAAEPASQKSAESKLMEPPTSKEMKERIIPDTPLPLGWINRVNGRWRYSVDRAYERGDIASRLLLDFELDGGVLKTREFGWDGTHSKGWIDARVDAGQVPYRINVKLASDRIPLLWLVAGKDAPRQKSTYRGNLTATGATVREIAASLDGELVLRASGAQLNNNGLDIVLGDAFGSVFDRLNPLTETEEYTNVECVVGAARADQGILVIEPGMVMRTDKVDILSRGTVDLGTEALNISFNTRSRKGVGISAGKAITPYLKVAGNIANPWLTVDPEAVALSGTAAIATAGISILAEGLYDRWIATAKSPCEEVFQKVKEHPDYRLLLAYPKPGIKGRVPVAPDG